MNTVRVFLQDQLWPEDPDSFRRRLSEFLAIASRRGIRPPVVWFHEVFRQDDAPYRQHEVDEIRTLTEHGSP